MNRVIELNTIIDGVDWQARVDQDEDYVDFTGQCGSFQFLYTKAEIRQLVKFLNTAAREIPND